MVEENRFVVLAAKGGGYYWHFQAVNSEIECASQVYTTKAAAVQGARTLEANAAGAKVYDGTGESSR